MKLSFLTIPILLFIGCQKEELKKDAEEECIIIQENDTNIPVNTTDYLMAKPGSWWKYSDGTTLNCGNPEFEAIYTLENEINGCKFLEKEVIISPVHPYFGKTKEHLQIYNSSNQDETIFRPIYDTVVGVFYEFHNIYEADYAKYNSITDIERKVIEKLDSLSLKNETFYDVIHIKHHKQTYFPFPNYTSHTIKDFYLAKNVGLIKYQSQFQTQFQEASLIDYHIAE